MKNEEGRYETRFFRVLVGFCFMDKIKGSKRHVEFGNCGQKVQKNELGAISVTAAKQMREIFLTYFSLFILAQI